MEFQHLIVKIPVEGRLGIDPAAVVDVFHKWVAAQSVPGVLLVDVAELLHVPKGPGVIAVGHEADYALDHSEGVWGLLYRRKTTLPGTNAERLAGAFEAALQAAVWLENAFPGALRFSRTEFELIINDRGIAPNIPATYAAAVPEMELFIRKLFGNSSFQFVRHDGDPRGRFGITAKGEKPFIPFAA